MQVEIQTITEGESVTLDGSKSEGAIEYFWNSSRDQLLGNNSTATLLPSFLSVGVHTVWLSIKGKDGNWANDDIQITVKAKSDIFSELDDLIAEIEAEEEKESTVIIPSAILLEVSPNPVAPHTSMTVTCNLNGNLPTGYKVKVGLSSTNTPYVMTGVQSLIKNLTSQSTAGDYTMYYNLYDENSQFVKKLGSVKYSVEVEEQILGSTDTKWMDTSTETINWHDAIDYCNVRGGRLPTLQELKDEVTICGGVTNGGFNYESSSYKAYSDGYKDNGFYDDYYWSSDEQYVDSAYRLNFYNAFIGSGYKVRLYTYVRCVRAGE